MRFWKYIKVATLSIAAHVAVASAATGQTETVVEQALTNYSNGALATSVRMNDKVDLEFIVDTGATLSGIWNSAIQQNSLTYNHVTNANIGAADGMVVLRILKFQSLNVSALSLKPAILTEFPDYYAYYRRPLSGILGADFLQDYLVVFDFPRQKIVFYPKNTNLTRKMPGYFDAVPLSYSRQFNALMMKVQVDGKTVNALLDTGAAMTTMLETKAKALGISTEGAPRTFMAGINGNEIPAYVVDIASVKAGTREWANTKVVVSEFKVEKSDGFSMLFGANHLGETPFAIDYGRRRLLLAKPSAVAIAKAEISGANAQNAPGSKAAMPAQQGFACAFPAAALEGLTCVRDE